MKIAIGCDHRGIDLKESIKKILSEQKIEVQDFGTNTKDSCDYPDFGFKVASAVANQEVDWGVLICNSGLGMSMVANKVPGIRAALCINDKLAEYARAHNDANVIVLGVEFVTPEMAKSILDKWINTKFEGDRHIKRLLKIKDWEEKLIPKENCDQLVKRWQDEARKWQSRAWRR